MGVVDDDDDDDEDNNSNNNDDNNKEDDIIMTVLRTKIEKLIQMPLYSNGYNDSDIVVDSVSSSKMRNQKEESESKLKSIVLSYQDVTLSPTSVLSQSIAPPTSFSPKIRRTQLNNNNKRNIHSNGTPVVFSPKLALLESRRRRAAAESESRRRMEQKKEAERIKIKDNKARQIEAD